MSYKAIIFDLDHTLLNYSMSELNAMQLTIEKHGFFKLKSFSWERFWHLYRKRNLYYWNERIVQGYAIHQVLERSFQDTLVELGLNHVESSILAQMYWQAFCHSCDLEEYATDLLTHLHRKYKLAIISNGIGEAQRSRLATGKLDHYFDTLVISDEVGYWKPDKQIFKEALNRLKMKSHEVLYVGDSLQDDYHGALNAEIDFCYYNRERHHVDPKVRPKFMIERLQDLLNHIGP